jgi:hypothetical protein
MTKRHRIQVTCKCTAYGFPHRIGGGKCYGRGWCESYRNFIDSSLCDGCNCFNNGECDVVNGSESFKYGECYRDEIRSQYVKDTYGNLPMTLEQIMEIQYNNKYQG